MDSLHKKNILFLEKYIDQSGFDWIDYDLSIEILYFSSGGGTHLYLIQNGNNKFLARINFFPRKNDWKVKRNEFETLQEIESLHIAPKAYLLNDDNELLQDFTIVSYIEGEPIDIFSDSDIVFLAKDLKKLHNFPKQYNKDEELPYSCSIYDEFSNGEDKQIEQYNYDGIEITFATYNRIKKNLGDWFTSLSVFDGCEHLSLCHADLKAENILRTTTGIMLIDWECAGIDIPETDIGRLFSGCRFTHEQQTLFLHEYYGIIPTPTTLQRIMSVRIVLDFFRILEDYCIHKRKPFSANAMIKELETYEKGLEEFQRTVCN